MQQVQQEAANSYPQHLEAYFMRRKQDKIIALTKFVKRYYVLQMQNP